MATIQGHSDGHHARTSQWELDFGTTLWYVDKSHERTVSKFKIDNFKYILNIAKYT